MGLYDLTCKFLTAGLYNLLPERLQGFVDNRDEKRPICIARLTRSDSCEGPLLGSSVRDCPKRLARCRISRDV